jgi:hypothetical protein
MAQVVPRELIVYANRTPWPFLSRWTLLQVYEHAHLIAGSTFMIYYSFKTTSNIN